VIQNSCRGLLDQNLHFGHFHVLHFIIAGLFLELWLVGLRLTWLNNMRHDNYVVMIFSWFCYTFWLGYRKRLNQMKELDSTQYNHKPLKYNTWTEHESPPYNLYLIVWGLSIILQFQRDSISIKTIDYIKSFQHVRRYFSVFYSPSRIVQYFVSQRISLNRENVPTFSAAPLWPIIFLLSFAFYHYQETNSNYVFRLQKILP
jgi:hypothetical protein